MKTAQTYVRVPSVLLRASLVRERIEAMGEASAGRLETQLAQWGARLDELVAKSGGTVSKAKGDFRKKVDDLRAQCQAAQTKLDAFRSAGGAKWGIFKTGIESAWSQIETAFEKLGTS
jgi:hypothetical protein